MTWYRLYLDVDLAGDGPHAGPEVVEAGVLDAEPVGQVAGVGEGRAQPHEPHLYVRTWGASDVRATNGGGGGTKKQERKKGTRAK